MSHRRTIFDRFKHDYREKAAAYNEERQQRNETQLPSAIQQAKDAIAIVEKFDSLFLLSLTFSLHRLNSQLSTIATKLDVGSEERQSIDDTTKRLRTAADAVRVLECTFDEQQTTEFDVNNVATVIPAYDAEVRACLCIREIRIHSAGYVFALRR